MVLLISAVELIVSRVQGGIEVVEVDTEGRKRKVVGLVVTTFLGIAATIGVGWYQLSQAQKQATLAEQERARAVRQSLVSIVEEHVLNGKPIDVPRLVRLIDQQRGQERVATPITAAEILEQAEFNILGSRYLAFERKQALKSVFDTLYSDLSTRAFAPYPPDTPNADLVNALARQIQDGKPREALQSLKRLQEAYARGLQEVERRRKTPSLSEALEQLFKENPLPLVFIFVVYIFLISWLLRRKSPLVGILRRVFGQGLSPSEAREKVILFRKAGIPEEMIFEVMEGQGFPRRWTRDELEELVKSQEREAKHDEVAAAEKVE